MMMQIGPLQWVEIHNWLRKQKQTPRVKLAIQRAHDNIMRMIETSVYVETNLSMTREAPTMAVPSFKLTYGADPPIPRRRKTRRKRSKK